MSRPLRSLTLAACLACALAPLAPAQGDGQNDAFQRARQTRTKNAAKIRRLILELGDADFAVREAAREGLRELGSEALPFLEAAQTDADAERAQAAVELTEELRWKIEPGLRDVVGDTLDHWPELAPTARLQGVTFLAERGGARGLPFLVRVARYDADPVVRVAAVDAYCQAAPERTPLDATLLEALADEAPSAQVRWLQSRLLLRGDDPEAGLEAALAAAQDDPQPPPQRLLELIDLLFARGRLDEARPFVEALAARLPEDARVVLRQGELLARDGETEQGLALLERVAQAVEAGQASDRTLIRLGQAYLACGEGEAGDLLYRQALGRNPFRHDLILARGDLALARGDAATALAIYLSEIRYAAPGEPDFTAVCTRLGKLLVDRGAPRFPDDAAFFRDAQRGRPLRAVHATVAAWLLDHGLLAEAAQELRIVAALDPQPAVLRALGDALRDLGDYDGAREAYARALEASPDDRELGGRLESVAGPAPDVAAQDSSGFRVWERRLQGDTQGVGPEAPPPLILGERLLACLPGGIALHAFDASDGTPRWTHTPKPPTGPEGSLEEQLGWEPVGLYAAPSGAVAATHPGRARDPAPLAAYLLNAYWRPLNRSWRKAKFLGVSLLLLDPETGELLSARELPDPQQVLDVAPAPHGAQQLVLSAASARRQSCELLDAVLGRARWRQRLGAAGVRGIAHLGQRLVVRHSDGLIALRPDGSAEWAAAVDDLSAGPVGQGERVLVGTRGGKVLALGRGDADAPEATTETVAELGDEAIQGLACRGDALFAAPGQTRVVALGEPGWTRDDLPRAAARELVACEDALFAISGMLDVYEDEVPTLLALDPQDGHEILRRPLPRPARWRASRDALALVAGEGQGALVFCVYPGERTDPHEARLTTLRLAAADALSEGQSEVAAVVARAYVRARGGYDVLGPEDLAFVARTLARSRRLDEAEDVVFFAEGRATTEELPRWTELRGELGLMDALGDAPDEDGPSEPDPEDSPPDDGAPDEEEDQ